MWPISVIFVSSIVGIVVASVFDDSILFQMRWSAEDTLDKEGFIPSDTVSIKSANNEMYKCHLPSITPPSGDELANAYTGKSPHDLIRQLYAQKTPCTYRIETYWAYELCHGKYIQQYHEEKDSLKRTKRQEYYLGSFVESFANEMETNYDSANPPTRLVGTEKMPYVPVKYIQGTVCDVTGNPRMTTVIYVCDESGRGQMQSLAETSSCEYEVVVPVKQLCVHPQFKPKRPKSYDIICSSANEESPIEPKDSVRWRNEQQSEFKQQYAGWKDTLKYKFNAEEPRATTEPILRSHPSEHKSESTTRVNEPATRPNPTPATPSADRSIIDAFLSGENCLYGGTGWWRHQYCHLDKVMQFHEEKDGTRIEILLGVWNEEVHRQWIRRQPHKAPVRDGAHVFQVSHFYSVGAICEETGVPRSAEVRLRCPMDTTLSADSMSVSLSEAKTCEYVLRVEAPAFCKIMQTVDEDGVFKK